MRPSQVTQDDAARLANVQSFGFSRKSWVQRKIQLTCEVSIVWTWRPQGLEDRLGESRLLSRHLPACLDTSSPGKEEHFTSAKIIHRDGKGDAPVSVHLAVLLKALLSLRFRRFP